MTKSGRHRYLIGSPTYLKQILMNIAGNAVKYTGEKGKVQVRYCELSAKGKAGDGSGKPQRKESTSG